MLVFQYLSDTTKIGAGAVSGNPSQALYSYIPIKCLIYYPHDIRHALIKLKPYALMLEIGKMDKVSTWTKMSEKQITGLELFAASFR